MPAVESELTFPMDVAFAQDGTAYIADFGNNRIRRVYADGSIHTVSGTGFAGDGPEGPSTQFGWTAPTSVSSDPGDATVLYVAAWGNDRVNRVDLNGGFTAFAYGAGGSEYVEDGLPATEATFQNPSSVAFDGQGRLYISDQRNHVLRRVSLDETIETVAGTPQVWGYGGDGGPALDAVFCGLDVLGSTPRSMITIAHDVVYVADSANNIVRSIDLDTMVIERVAGVPWGCYGELPIPTAQPLGNGGAAREAYLSDPRDVAVGVEGELYIADTANQCVRVVDPDGIIRTFAGTCATDAAPELVGEGGRARSALLNWPHGVATDASGNVYIADTNHHVIRRVAHESVARRILASEE